MRHDRRMLHVEIASPAATTDSLLAVLRSLGPIEEDFPPIDELPHTPVEL